MARQDPNPPPWTPGSGDGCTGVLDLGYTIPCDNHDRKYAEGGTVEDKLIADGEFYDDMCATKGFWGWAARHGIARVRYVGVRFATYNYPPGHPARRKDILVEAFNWLGPGPGQLNAELRRWKRV